MAPGMLHAVLHYLHRLNGAGLGEPPDDAELLRRFAAARDEAAFAALIGRHGPMVWGVCKRLLRRPQDAEDAFQATFLVLVRKSHSLLRPDLVGPWLHAVAVRTASRLRAEVLRRDQRERPVVEEPVMEATPDLVWRDLRPVLDEEVGRLPAKYRAAFILCHLEGLTNEAAARRLGCPKGTVLSRLARGRQLLQRRLARRGLGLTAGALAAALAVEDCSAAVPVALGESTVRLGLAFAVGAAPGSVSVHAATLAEGVLKSMFLTQMKLTVAVLLALGVTVAGMGLLAFGQGRGQSAAAADGVADKKSGAPAVAAKPAEEDKKPAGANIAAGEQARAWRATLDQPVALDDFGATIADALDVLEQRHGLSFEVNDKAFAQEGDPNVLATDLSKRPLPKRKNLTVATALRLLLDRQSVPALVVIRKDTIEITTVAYVRAELGIPEGRPLLPLVWEEMEGLTLARALQQLAKASGMNVVLDSRALSDDAANLRITVQFANVPVDTAVRVLASMADLQMVQLDNVFYVTTPKRAAQLLAEQKRPGDESLPVLQSPKQSGKFWPPLPGM
jgi:RNA polymerase sigma factor (sigma-70 family)